MKQNLWLVFLGMISLSLVAQPVTNAPPSPAIPAPAEASATNATKPAADKAGKKKSAKKAAKKTDTKAPARKAPELRTVPLVAGNASVIASNVNVRGQAKLKSEVITRLARGQQVAVLEEVLLKKSGPDEPSAWARIILPAKTHVWVNAAFIDATAKTVKPSKLKIRGGPGENYSTLGFLKKGDTITEVSTKGDWIEIEAPAEASGFVAAQYLRQEEASTPIATTPVTNEPPTTVAAVSDNPPVAPLTNSVITNAAVVAAVPDANTNTPPTPIEILEPKPDEPPPKRIVQREGIVRGTFSIQAPTRYELISPDNRRAINYLLATSPNLDLSRYKGLHIIVTGEEGLDERWRNTPVITIQKIQVLE